MRNKWVQLTVGLLISGVFLYYSFSKADFSALGHRFSSINYLYTIPFVILTLMTMWVRALRWHYLMVPAKQISSRELFTPLMIGFAFNGIFPARAGEFARAWLVQRSHGVPFTSAFATVVVERLYDLAVLCLVILVIFNVVTFEDIPPQTYDARWSMPAAVLHGGLLLVMLGLVAVPGWLAWRRRGALAARERLGLGVLAAMGLGGAGWLVAQGGLTSPQILHFGKLYEIDAEMLRSLANGMMKLFGLLFLAVVLFLIGPVRHTAERVLRVLPLPLGLNYKLAGMVHTVGRGLDSLTSWRLVLPVIFHTLLLWVMVAFTLQMMAWGFPGLEQMTFLEGMGVTMLISLAIIIPAAPGYWGLYEVGCVVAVQLLGISQDYNLALSYSLVIHFLQMAPIILIGLIMAARENIRAGEVMQAQEAIAAEAADDAEADTGAGAAATAAPRDTH